MASPTGDAKLDHAIQVIKSTYNDDVRVKDKDVHKFGACIIYNTATAHTVFTAQDSNSFNEVYVTANAITHVVHSGTNTGVVIGLEGHTISGTASSFKVQTVTMNGQTPVALDTPLWRVSRAYTVGSTTLDGRMFVYEGGATTLGVPNASSATHLTLPEAQNQSEKAATTFSNVDYALVTGFWASIRRGGGGAGANADIVFEVRTYGGVFRQQVTVDVSRNGSSSIYVPANPYFVVPPNSDVRIRALGDTLGAEIAAGWSCYLAIRTKPKPT